ncbi:LURP-one-related/scramblase family protein [Halarchaeum sp. P4]|uniref:LURP-one-related/scramblase family protein n=1 Tax=Halarchaeum sp. P4 TaxID=3421639 RepID=UPI003EB79BE2
MADYDISTVELDGDRYEVVQSLVRNKYAVRDAAGNVVLRGKQKMLKLKEEFPFVDADGNDAFTVKAGGIMDIAGNYAIVDAATGEDVVVLDEDYSLFAENWTVRDPDTGAALATIRSQNKLLEVLRHFVGAAGLIPHKYEIKDADGDHVGRISGQFSLKDKYTVTIDDASDVPKEAVVAAACVLDALEGS